MDDMTRRQALQLAATAGVVVAGVAAVGRGEAKAPDEKPKSGAVAGDQDTINVKELNEAFEKFEKDTSVPKALDKANVCQTYKMIRPTLAKIIDGLNAVGVIVPIAKRAAAALETLRTMLDALCP